MLILPVRSKAQTDDISIIPFPLAEFTEERASDEVRKNSNYWKSEWTFETK